MQGLSGMADLFGASGSAAVALEVLALYEGGLLENGRRRARSCWRGLMSWRSSSGR